MPTGSASIIARRPTIASHLPLVCDERAGVVAANEAFADRPTGNFDRVAAAIGDDAGARPHVPIIASSDRIKRLFEMPALGSRGWIGAAAAVVIVAQTTAIATLVVPRHSPTFTAASGGREAPGAGTSAVVRFADGATTSAVTELLAGLGMTIVDGPRSGGLFTVRLGTRDMTEAERNRAIADLKARSDLVAFVTRLP